MTKIPFTTYFGVENNSSRKDTNKGLSNAVFLVLRPEVFDLSGSQRRLSTKSLDF